MTQKSEEDIYRYVYDHKSDLRVEYNADQEKYFDQANEVGLKLSSQLIAFSSLLLSVVAGFVLSNVDKLDYCSKDAAVVAIMSFVLSIIFGLVEFHFASNFYIKWARRAHEKGGLVHEDSSRTVEELDILKQKIRIIDSELPESSGSIPVRMQAGLFVLGLILMLYVLLRTVY